MSDEPDKKAETKPIPFWLIIIPDAADKPPQCLECGDRSAFERALKSNVLEATEELHAFAFRGHRVRLGNLAPVGSFEVDGEVVQVGIDATTVNDSGHFVPFIPKPKTG